MLSMYKYTAIIVEPRKHKALEFVLNNVCECLSNEWKIVLFHGTRNKEYSQLIVDKLNKMYNERITLVLLNVFDLNSITYSELFATKSIIYDYIDTDIFLVFQTDSMIIQKNAHLINDFLDYDYVGSPWIKSDFIPAIECDFIGNGGFSLRKKSKMLEIIENVNWYEMEPFNYKLEDVFFSRKYSGINVKKPEYNKALGFCQGEEFSENFLACHQFWSIKNYNLPLYEHFLSICPEMKILEDLQGVEQD
jgi:hypothetical protein